MTFPIKDRSDPLPILVGWPHDGQSKGRTCYSGLFEWKGLLSSRKSFLRGMGSMENHEKPWKTMKNHEKPYNRSFARRTFSYFKNQWILHPDFRNCTFKNHTTGLCPSNCNSSARHQNLRSRTFSARARSSSKPHNLALLVGTTSHSSGNRNLEPDTFSSRARSTPFPCFANGRPHNLALLAEPFIKPNE